VKHSDRLMHLLGQPDLLRLPSCYDALSARMIARAGFAATMVSGFCVSGSRLGLPDTGLISFAEMRDQVRDICGAAPNTIVIADGDTGYGNALNAQRTVREYARAGAACIMIEDQLSPKRCGHTKGKAVVDRAEARQRIRAAVEAGRSAGIRIMARTDARATHGFDEALDRCRMFADEGADIVFLEAPHSEQEMEASCRAIDRPMMANMVPGGHTPVLPPRRLRELGFRLAVYPLVPFAAAVDAMSRSLDALRDDTPAPPQVGFEELKDIVGFNDYYREEARLAGWNEPPA
jgi:2-methylisocitrate lyase-like PEP mutase family enzyme